MDRCHCHRHPVCAHPLPVKAREGRSMVPRQDQDRDTGLKSNAARAQDSRLACAPPHPKVLRQVATTAAQPRIVSQPLRILVRVGPGPALEEAPREVFERE